MAEEKNLLVRSSGMTFERAVNHLQQEHPEAEIHLLVTTGAHDKYRDREEFVEVFKTEKNSLNSKCLAPKTRKKLQKNNYERAYLLYNYDKSAGYANVEALLRKIKPNQVIGLTYQLQTHSLTNSAGFYYRLLKNKLKVCMSAVINWLIYLIAWPFSLAGMLLVRLRGSHEVSENFTRDKQ